MLASDLKQQLLQWLYEKYLEQPTKTWDIAPFLAAHGLESENEIIDFGYAIKNTGLLKEYSGLSIYTFNAAVSMKGIDYISEDVHREIVHQLGEMRKITGKYYQLSGQLSHLPNNEVVAVDLGMYMQSLGLVKMKVSADQVLMRITTKGLDWADPNSPDRAGTHHRMIA